MSILWADGFDGYGNFTGLQVNNGPWFDYFIGLAWGFNTAYGRRTGSYGIGSGNSGHCKKYFGNNLATVIWGSGVYRLGSYSAASSQAGFLRFFSGATAQVSLCYGGGASNKLVVRRGDYNGTVIGTTDTDFLQNTWRFIEIKVYFHASAGTVEVKFDGVTVLSLTGQNTDPAGTGYGTLFHIEHTSTTNYYDDMYLVDTNGSINNDFLGDVRIDAYRPTSDGSYETFSLSTGSDMYALIDEYTPNNTDYVQGDSVNEVFTTKITSTEKTGPDGVVLDILGVVVTNFTYNPEGGGIRKVKPICKSSASEELGAEYTLTTAYTAALAVLELNPNGDVAWTSDTINTAEFGLKVTA